MIASTNRLISSMINQLKNLYSTIFSTKNKLSEYYLKLDGYYYCEVKKITILIIRVRNKRITEKLTIQEILNEPEYFKELHPADICIIGILANNERNGIINTNYSGWRRMNHSRDYDCFIKSKPLLEVSRKYTSKNNIDMVTLYSKFLNKSIEISIIDLCKNPALMYALDGHQAISLGYDISELYARKEAS